MNRQKIQLIIMIILALPILTIGQTQNYYYYNSEKLNLNTDYTKLNITVSSSFQKSLLSAEGFSIIEVIDSSSRWIPNDMKNIKVEFSAIPTQLQYNQKIQDLENISGVIAVSPYVGSSVATSIGFSNIFHVKLKQSSDISQLQQDVSAKKLVILEQNSFMPLWYTLSLTANSTLNSLEACNYFWETGFYDDVDPAFSFNISTTCTNDPDFSKLWGFKNATHPGIDIKACDAWNLSNGFGVKVAVFDTGIELNHSDLSGNVSSLSYDTHTKQSPSLAIGSHGTHVAGTIGAIGDNNFRVIGVAPKCTLLNVSNELLGSTKASELADGFNWAWQNGADVINCSWRMDVDPGGLNVKRSKIVEDALDNVLTKGRGGKGTVVVFATGNQNTGVVYPANYHKDILAVGSIDSDGKRSSFSNKGLALDVVAPGNQIYSTTNNNSAKYSTGTSMAAPHVAGTAALILSINPRLTLKQVNDLIEKTAQKVGGYVYQSNTLRPNGNWNSEMGYGLVDAYKAVDEATKISPTIDLYISDVLSDKGFVPGYPWSNANPGFSPDIWLRNQADGITNQTDQTPVYNQNSTMYVYVRVKNRGYAASLGTEKLALYWSRSGSNQKWPDDWNGTNPLLGNKIGDLTIPVLNHGDESILQFQWTMPAPIPAAGWVWPAGLLARVENSTTDLITPYPFDLAKEIYYNNNIASKNFAVFNYVVNAGGSGTGTGTGIGSGSSTLHKHKFLTGNTSNSSSIFDIVLKNPNNGELSVTEFAEVHVELDEQGWNILSSHLEGRQDVIIHENNTFTLLGNGPFVFSGINFPANTRIPLFVSFNFLTEEVDETPETYQFNLLQKQSTEDPVLGENWTGGVEMIIHKGSRDLFEADAGSDQQISLGESTTLQANQLNENAEYNWYDSEGNLVYSGANFSVTPLESETYKLEVIADADGFKDYDEVDVIVKNYEIENISPNPASTQVVVDFKAQGTTSAYLMLVCTSNCSSTTNYSIGNSQSQIIIDVSSYTPGTYNAVLVVNGVAKDSKSFVIQ